VVNADTISDTQIKDGPGVRLADGGVVINSAIVVTPIQADVLPRASHDPPLPAPPRDDIVPHTGTQAARGET